MSKISVFGKGKSKIYKILESSLNDIWNYDEITNLTSINFIQDAGNYILQENEVFFIDLNNEEKLKISDLLNTTNAENISRKTLLDLKYMFVINKKNIYFQRVYKTNLIDKPFIYFKDTATLHTKEKILVLQNRTEVAFVDNKVYFFKFSDLTAVFSFLSYYYREATKDDLEKFKNYERLSIKESLELDKLPKTILQKIAQIVDNLKQLQDNFDDYKRYASKYVKNFKKSKIEISTKEDIENLHNIIFEKFYQSDIAGEKRIANSFKKL